MATHIFVPFWSSKTAWWTSQIRKIFVRWSSKKIPQPSPKSLLFILHVLTLKGPNILKKKIGFYSRFFFSRWTSKIPYFRIKFILLKHTTKNWYNLFFFPQKRFNSFGTCYCGIFSDENYRFGHFCSISSAYISNQICFLFVYYVIWSDQNT